MASAPKDSRRKRALRIFARALAWPVSVILLPMLESVHVTMLFKSS